MAEHSHKMVVLYRNYYGLKKKIEQEFESWEEARECLDVTCARLTELGYENVRGWVNGENPTWKGQQVAVSNEPTHWKITVKDSEGCYLSSVIPISRDVDAELAKIHDDLKVVGVEKVRRNIVTFTGCTGLMDNTIV